jgi:hypothetical protein
VQDFKSEPERRQFITDNAEYFTVVRYLGPRGGYERHELPDLSKAQKLAQRLANESGKVFAIYAVIAPHDTWVENVEPQK